MSRAADHVEAFNQAVVSGDWDTFAERFAEDATMSFVGVPAGPFEGRTAIAEAYRTNPPTETMTLIEDGTQGADGTGGTARFSWAGGGTGTMRLSWSPADQVTELVVSFD